MPNFVHSAAFCRSGFVMSISHSTVFVTELTGREIFSIKNSHQNMHQDLREMAQQLIALN